MEAILLDELIRSCVLLPILLMVILVSMSRQNLSEIMKPERKQDMQQVKINSLLSRVHSLRSTAAAFISPLGYLTRYLYFAKKDEGVLCCPQATNPFKTLESMMKADPSQTMGMLKSQISFVVLQGGIAYFINVLFSGFLVAKSPFPLTFRFKSMLQRGIDVPSLDVTYVSSLSWYFFVMVSIGGFLSVLAPNSPPVSDPMLDPAANMMMSPIGNPDWRKQFSQEREALEMHKHDFCIDDAPDMLLRQWTSLPS